MRCFRELGKKPEHWEEAIRRLERLRAEHPENPWIPYHLAGLTYLSNDPGTAALYAEASHLFARRGNLEKQIDARGARIIALQWQEFSKEADRRLAIAQEQAVLEGLQAESDDPDLAMQVRVGQAEAHLDEGADPEAAWRLLQQDAARIDSGDAAEQRESAWRRMACRVAHELGRFPEARRHGRRWLELQTEPGARARALDMLARIQLSSEIPSDDARREQERLSRDALYAAQAGGLKDIAAAAHGRLGRLLRGTEGRRHLERCIELSRGLGRGGRDIEAKCLSSLAVLLAAEREEEARRRLEQARERASAAGDPWTTSVLDVDGMRVDWATRPPEEALARAEATLDELEARLLSPAGEMEIRARLRARWLDPHYWVAGRLLEGEPSRSHLERAFRVIEGRRGRGLSAAAGRPVQRPVTLDEVQASLRPDEAMLVFLLGDWENLYGEFEGGGWLLAVTTEDARVHRLPGRAELQPRVTRLAGLRDPEDSPELLERLHKELLEPALLALPQSVEHLVLLPDLPLHGLAFAALGVRSGPPLAERFQLSRVPSATLWHTWRQREPAPHPEPALVLADPELPTLETATENDRSAGSPPRTAGPPTRKDLGPLPHARREGRRIRHRLGWDTVVLLGSEANEAALQERAPRSFAVLHLAAHAVGHHLGSRPPAVYLAPAAGHDGLLTPEEIEGLPLNDTVVVLAACETAAGEAIRGEGVLSLGRAFLAAGARTVVASLWRLPDAEAAEVFEEFYRQLAAGHSVVDALNTSQRDASKRVGRASTWAGLVVLGDGGHIPFPGGRPWWDRGATLHVAALAGAFLGTLLVVAWAARRGRLWTADTARERAG